MHIYIYIYTHMGGFLRHGGFPSHHGCFNTKLWSSMTWMIWGVYPYFRKPPHITGTINWLFNSYMNPDSWDRYIYIYLILGKTGSRDFSE